MANETIVKQVDVMALMGALQTKGKARLSDFATPIDEEKPEVSPFEQKYRELKDKHPDALLLFRVGDFYEAYFEDAEESSKLLGVTLTLRSDDGSRKAGFPKYALDAYLPKLVRAGKRIAICDEIKSINEPNKEDKTMRLNMNANKTENQNVAMQPQVNNNAAPAIEDAEAVEVAEVEDIVPVVKPKSEPAAPEEPKAVTVPLSEHGTMVIGGVPKPAMPQRDKNGKFMPKAKSEAKPDTKPAPKADTKPEAAAKAGGYSVVLVPAKDGGEWPKLYGFKTEKDAEKMVGKMAKSIRNSWDRDEQGLQRFYIKAGKKYCEVFQQLADALNKGDQAAVANACKASVAIYEGAVASGKAEREAKRAEREPAKPAPKCYTNEDVAAMLRKVLAGGDVPEDIKKLLKAA